MSIRVRICNRIFKRCIYSKWVKYKTLAGLYISPSLYNANSYARKKQSGHLLEKEGGEAIRTLIPVTELVSLSSFLSSEVSFRQKGIFSFHTGLLQETNFVRVIDFMSMPNFTHLNIV